MSIMPVKKVNEIVNLFGSPALKNLNSFSELGKNKAIQKKAMQNLEAIDPVQANTGLGILYAYENNLPLSLEAFKKAYIFSGHGLIESIHYANAEFRYGDQSIGISIYLDLIEKKNLADEVLRNIILSFTTYLYLSELDLILQNQKVAGLVNEILKIEIFDAKMILNFLHKNHISVEYYRKLRRLPDYVFNKYYTTPTKILNEKILNLHRNEMSISFILPAYPNQLYGNDLLSKINDELQLLIFDLNKEFNVSSSSPEDLITVFFSVEDVIEGVA
ncbi:hypothetical protein ABTM70_07090 [Acinetobacter baumannii]|uniref:hypothetical protein n=1 Tax=Acinetobacter baumannii TaxID=470 RepID=UPI000B33D470|nr:hypothetical protein [Acinetobacter baumannii]EHU1901540.1 hypothetical protein [Acinetobacter baumannii]HEM6657740.1 hypothetical protein [Acinetobacter baumannii]